MDQVLPLRQSMVRGALPDHQTTETWPRSLHLYCLSLVLYVHLHDSLLQQNVRSLKQQYSGSNNEQPILRRNGHTPVFAYNLDGHRSNLLLAAHFYRRAK